jgi:hypothetical protein
MTRNEIGTELIALDGTARSRIGSAFGAIAHATICGLSVTAEAVRVQGVGRVRTDWKLEGERISYARLIGALVVAS